MLQELTASAAPPLLAPAPLPHHYPAGYTALLNTRLSDWTHTASASPCAQEMFVLAMTGPPGEHGRGHDTDLSGC